MKSYGQFCSIARALELLGERWTLLIVRELLCGSTRFGDIRRGIPRVSRTMLSARLRELADAGVIARDGTTEAPAYALTAAGKELAAVVAELGTWGQRWLPRLVNSEEFDPDVVLWDVQRRVRFDSLPPDPLVVRFEIDGTPPRMLLLKRSEASLCATNPGFPERLLVRTGPATLQGWWRGDVTFPQARRMGLLVEGPRPLVRAFPTWFHRYQFSNVPPAGRQSPLVAGRGERGPSRDAHSRRRM